MPNPLENLQQFNIAGNAQNALLQGMQVGDALRQRKEQQARQQATDEAYRGIITGDKSGINALASLPGGAKDAYTINNTLNERQVRADVAAGKAPATALAAINWDDYANLNKEQNAIALQNAKTMGQLALMADTPQKWDATIDQLGPQFAQYKGQFAMREAIIARAGEATTFLEQQAPKYQVLPADAELVNTRDPAALAAIAQRNSQPPANDLKAQAEAAIAAGADPEKVYARMKELGGQASPAPATFPGWY
jgi:hypothetical protein